jgi:hypothetical protein
MAVRPVALGRVVLGRVAQERALARAERLRVLGGRVGHLPAVRPAPVARLVLAQAWLGAVRATVRAVQPRAALRLHRVPAGKTTAGLRCRARDSLAASSLVPRACPPKFHAPID